MFALAFAGLCGAVFLAWLYFDDCMIKLDKTDEKEKFEAYYSKIRKNQLLGRDPYYVDPADRDANKPFPKFYGPPSYQIYGLITDKVCEFFTKK